MIELLVVVAILGILAALILPTLTQAKGRAWRAACINNLHNISAGMLMYAEDHAGKLPASKDSPVEGVYYFYKELMKGYVGLKGDSSRADKIFACPADRGDAHVPQICALTKTDYSSYLFNAGNTLTNGQYPGIAGAKLTGIKQPARTFLVAEHPAFIGYSWHKPQSDGMTVSDGWFAYNNAMCEAAYADGHINYVKIYMNGKDIAAFYDPIPGYEYQWSGD